MRSIEICAGAGGQALGLEQAGFEHAALVETDPDACATLRLNRPRWDVVEGDVGGFSAASYKGVDLLAGGVPCPPFSAAGKQLGRRDERDLFPEALRLVGECDPRAVMLENVRGLFDPKFSSYRNEIIRRLENLGYACFWDVFNACDYGVPQLRPRSVLVALKHEHAKYFSWPVVNAAPPQSVGRTLLGEMSRGGWPGAAEWALAAKGIAPTLVGGSKKHGGPDLGPTRARLDWEKLGVDGRSIADEPPFPDFVGMPKLTVKMAALIQGFPPEWMFSGKKTAAYKQVGNAFPPPVAKAMGRSIVGALKNESTALVRAGRLPAQKRLFPAEPPSKSLAR